MLFCVLNEVGKVVWYSGFVTFDLKEEDIKIMYKECKGKDISSLYRIINVNNSDIMKEIMDKQGYLELDTNEERWRFEEITLDKTKEEVNREVVERIREKYDVNKEFETINLGIVNPQSQEYIDYKNYIEECREWGKLEKQKYEV